MTGINYLDTYCERAGAAGLWAEPLNGLSNFGFVLAAVLSALALAGTRRSRVADLWALVVVLGAIGIGSALWHFAPTGHTVLMDIIPIAIFINLYLIVALRRLLGFPWLTVAGAWATYFVVGLAARSMLPKELFNGSILYAPTLLALAALSFVAYRRDRAAGKVLGSVLAVWTISLLLRTADLAVCEVFPLGTHFLWHLLNSWVLWRLLAVLIAQAARGADAVKTAQA